MTATELTQVPIRSLYRMNYASGERIQVGVGHDGFIKYAVKLVGRDWQPCPEHPFVADVVRQLKAQPS